MLFAAMPTSPTAALRVLLIDDHALFREGVAMLLHKLHPELALFQAGDCATALALVAEHGAFDLALIDLTMPGMPGIDGIRALHEAAPDMPVVVMSGDDDTATVLRSIDRGAVGFVPKSSSAEVMIGALRLVLAKGIYLPPSAFAASHDTRARASLTPARREDLSLTPRQFDVLREILRGRSTKLICRELGLSEGTVKTHTTAVLRALNVTTRTQAIVAASRLGLSIG